MLLLILYPISSMLFLTLDRLTWLWLKLSKLSEYISEMLCSSTISSRLRPALLRLLCYPLLIWECPIDTLSKSSGY